MLVIKVIFCGALVIKILIVYKSPSFENIRLSNLLFKFLIQDKWKFPIYNELIIEGCIDYVIITEIRGL